MRQTRRARPVADRRHGAGASLLGVALLMLSPLAIREAARPMSDTLAAGLAFAGLWTRTDAAPGT